LNFQPSGFAANDTSFWISFVEYSATGVPLQKFPGPNEATYMEFLGDTLDFQPKGFAVNGTSFWISYDRSIMEYSAAGVCLQSIAGPAGAYMEFWGNTLFTVAYNNKCHPDLCCMDKMGRTIKLLVNH
ncbi:hypothetical protein HaLaN_16458, partial [Haematococcus lacustris]